MPEDRKELEKNYRSFRYRHEEAHAPFFERMSMILDRKFNQLGDFYNSVPEIVGSKLEKISPLNKWISFGLGVTAAVALVATGVEVLASAAAVTAAVSIASGVSAMFDFIKDINLTNNQEPSK